MEKLPKSTSRRSSCPIATSLDLLGDKWTLLIIRDIALFDKHRNKEFQEAGEGIPTNILASRLKMLVQNGLIEKRPYQNNPPRFEYHLTKRGADLLPTMKALAEWAEQNVAGVKRPKLER